MHWKFGIQFKWKCIRLVMWTMWSDSFSEYLFGVLEFYHGCKGNESNRGNDQLGIKYSN